MWKKYGNYICLAILVVATFLAGVIAGRSGDNREPGSDHSTFDNANRVVDLTAEYFTRRKIELGEREERLSTREASISAREARLRELENIAGSGIGISQEIELRARATIEIVKKRSSVK